MNWVSDVFAPQDSLYDCVTKAGHAPRAAVQALYLGLDAPVAHEAQFLTPAVLSKGRK